MVATDVNATEIAWMMPLDIRAWSAGDGRELAFYARLLAVSQPVPCTSDHA
jgi:hypothetical protein